MTDCALSEDRIGAKTSMPFGILVLHHRTPIAIMSATAASIS
jgi:hypothetical protein